MATGSTGKEVTDWIDRTGAAYPILYAEDTELNTMVRSNPGLLLLHDGKVADKWSNNNLPEVDNNNTTLNDVTHHPIAHPVTMLLLWFVVPLLLIVGLDSLWIGHKFYKHHIYVKRFKLKKS